MPITFRLLKLIVRQEMKSVLVLLIVVVCISEWTIAANTEDEVLEQEPELLARPHEIQELINFSKIEKRKCTRTRCCPVPLVCCNGFCCYNYKRLMPMIFCV